MDLSQLTSTFTGYVKQLNTSSLDKRTLELIEDCFPNFTDLEKTSLWLNQDGAPSILIGSNGAIPPTLGRMRRFSGGNTLPRGRYYSVCLDSSGNDGGTLLWELMSYWSANAKKFPELIDSTVHKWATEHYQSVVNFDLNKPFLMLTASNIDSFTPDGKIELGETIGIVMPLILKRIALNKVLDLRHPNIQDKFAEIFGTLEMEQKEELHMMKKKPRNFFHILRTLLSPDPGGYAFHEGVASYCRNSGIEGIIFPSARRNCYVKANKAGEILAFDGWNFVDFRDAPSVNLDYKKFFGLQPKWLNRSNTNIQIFLYETQHERQWFLYGIEEGERLRYDVSWRLRTNQRQESVVWNERTVAREWNSKNNEIAQSEYLTGTTLNLSIKDEVEKLNPQNLPEYLKKQIDESSVLNGKKVDILDKMQRNEKILSSLKLSLRAGILDLSSIIKTEDSQVKVTTGEILLASLVSLPDLCFEGNYNLGENWFFYRFGTCDAEIQTKCPACDDETIWPVLRGNFFPMCRKCGFHDGKQESPDIVRGRFLNWAKG